MKFIILVFGLLISGFVFAGSCPAGATNCFLCGGVGGIACTTDCTGSWDENVGDYVSCRCPQGKSCECYCPYIPEVSDECAVDPDCVSKTMPMPAGVIGYVSKTEGNVILKKAGTGKEITVTPLTIINEGDTLVVPLDGKAFVVFPGANIRGFVGEIEVTIKKEAEDGVGLINVGDFVGLFTKIKNQIGYNKYGEPASTVTGAGRLVLYENKFDDNGNRIEYNMESEALFQVKNGVQSVKVIEGNVTATNSAGKRVSVLTGEQFSTDGNFSASEKKPFDYRIEDLSFADGYAAISCNNTCQSGYTQTIFPGCSCVIPGTSGSNLTKSGSSCCGSAFILLLPIAGLAFYNRKRYSKQ